MDIFSKYNEWLTEQEGNGGKFQKKFVGCRGYGHFDTGISIKKCLKSKSISQEICDPESLARHKFWPFIRQDKKTRRYTQDLAKRLTIKTKVRPIMYASHKDSLIMAFYAWILKQSYEERINSTPAKDAVIGYRKISINKNHNKSNIDFSNDIFQILQETNDSVLFCLDIKDFFGNIGHAILARAVQRFAQDVPSENLSPVLRAVTHFRYVFKADVEKALGKDKSAWTDSRKYNTRIRDGGLIHKNKKKHGIPQGSPISDILANIYLYDFDIWMSKTVLQHGGVYRRYSDDILVIVPKSIAKGLFGQICQRIQEENFKLEISKNKTEAFYVDAKSSTFKDITSEYVAGYSKNKDSAQYLGFNMNLDYISVRPGSIAKSYRREVAKNKRKHEKHNAGKVRSAQNQKYQYFKNAARKVGSCIPQQLRKMRRRIQKMRLH